MPNPQIAWFATLWLTLIGIVSFSANVQAADPGAGGTGDAAWTALFNGRNLDGWTVKCRPQDHDKVGYWKVEDGTITAETPPGSDHHYIWLLTDKEFGDFELRLKVQTFAETTGNSGVQVRSRYDDKEGWLDGPQVDINPPGPWRCGFVYDETRGAQVWLWPDVGRPANAKPEHAPQGWKWQHADGKDVWNEMHIICRGPHIKTIVNGVPIADYDGRERLTDESHRTRNVGLQGHIGLQIHPGKQLTIRFKDIEVRPLPAADVAPGDKTKENDMAKSLIEGVKALRAGDWDRAHQIAQDDASRRGSWLHGVVHIVEGDESNARYWYRQAGREFPGRDAVESELDALLEELQPGD